MPSERAEFAIFIKQKLWAKFRNICAQKTLNEALVLESLLHDWLEHIEERPLIHESPLPESYELEPGCKSSADIKTTAEIFRDAVLTAHVNIPEDAALFIVQELKNDLYEVQQAVNWFIVTCSFRNRPMTIDIARESLATFATIRAPQRKCEEIQSAVAFRFQVELKDLKGKDNSRRVARPRQVAMYLTRELTGLSWSEIGRLFGNRSISTVKNAISYIEQHKLDIELGGVVGVLLDQIEPLQQP